MRFIRTGSFELLSLVAVIAGLIAVQSARLDRALVVVWAMLLVGSCIRAVGRRFDGVPARGFKRG